MKMKSVLICVLAIAALLLSGCGKQQIPAAETEPNREIDICLNAYDGVIAAMEEDMDGNRNPCEYGAISVLGAAGEPIANGFASSGYSELTLLREGDSFEGWMECRYDEELGNYVIASDTLYTTEELMALPVLEQPVAYVAKWAGISVEEYFAMDTGDVFEDASSSSVFAFSANGGNIHFHSYNNEEYKTVAYGYALEYGQALNDVMGTEYGDAIIGVTKDGAEFLGWTLYVADEITWSNEEIYDTEILCLLYNDAGSRGVEYAHLKNGTLVGEYMPTEQLCGMTTYGESYLAIAIWSE